MFLAFFRGSITFTYIYKQLAIAIDTKDFQDLILQVSKVSWGHDQVML